jgi:hypothetical protein
VLLRTKTAWARENEKRTKKTKNTTSITVVLLTQSAAKSCAMIKEIMYREKEREG